MITAVTTCMGRREHLETTLPLMLEEFDHVIVVDWSCPQGGGEWAEEQGAEVLYRRGEKFFNYSKARNAGAHRVKTRNVCFIDADGLVMAGAKQEIESRINLRSMAISGLTSTGLDVHSLKGFIGCDIGQFWGVGGYDESFEGYGLEDGMLRAKLLFERGVIPNRLPVGSLAALRHSNEIRGRNFEEPIEVSSKRNHSLLMSYLKTKGVTDWLSDPRTAGIVYRD